MAKWLLVQPKSFHCWEALGLGYLASSLKEAGEQVEFASGFFDTDAEIIEAAHRADIVGFGCTSPQMAHAIHLSKYIKSHKVFGGVHPSVLPQETLKHCNQVVIGEGEQAVKWIAAGDKSCIVRAPYICDLDTVAPPDRTVIKQWRNVEQAYRDTGERIGSLFSSRGCPFNCAFCASKSLWTRKVRFRSAENIYAEFKQITKDLNLDFIKFSDDTFTLKRSLVEAFCELKLSAGDKTPWGANIRANTVDYDLLSLMKRAGCREVWIGVESGSPPILKAMQKGITVEQVRRCFADCHALGLMTRAYMLLGMPEENLSDIAASEALIDQIKPGVVGWTILAPYPGTAFFDKEKHKGVDWSKVDEYGNDMTSTRYLTNDQLKAEQTRLVAKYQRIATFRQKDESNSLHCPVPAHS